MRVWFYLKGDLATVQFNISTGWYLEKNRRVFHGPVYDIPETDPRVLERMRKYSGLFGQRPETRKVVLCDWLWPKMEQELAEVETRVKEQQELVRNMS
jgi:hypothetical protein